jgi:hypothetical protein
MSRQLALDTICLRATPRLAHTEYSLNYHGDYIRRLTGLDPATAEATRKLYQLWGIDFNWSVNDGLHGDWGRRGRCTDMGHAVYAGDGSDQRAPATCPFREPEEVWAFDPITEYGLPDFAAQVAAYEAAMQHARTAWPDQLTTGGYYKTIVSGAIQTFGWDMLLLAGSDLPKLERVLHGFFRFTQHHMRAWAQTSVEVIMQHDDFVWTEGPFLRPDFYRQAIIPRYAELWRPLRAAGKRIIFCSDGKFTMFMDDLAAAGADGFCFEPCNDFAWVVERFGQSHCLIGSGVDCRDLTFGGWPQVQAAMDRTLALAPRCRGLIWAVGNHLPANISEAMLDQYLAYLQAHWQR